MIKKLNDICSFVSGNAWKSSEFADEGIPIIRINNLNNNVNDFKYWKGDYDKKYLIYEGDLLVSLSGTIKTFQWNGPEALLNQRIVKVTANPDTNQDWVYYQISHVIEQIANKGKHAVIKNVSIKDLKNFEVDVPDFQTQNKIVAILDKATALVQKRQQTIDLLDKFLQSQFYGMFGDPLFNDKGIRVVELESVTNKITDGTHQSPKFISEGIPFILVANIIANKITYETSKFISEEEYRKLTKNTPIEVNDILMTSVGSYGNPAIVESDRPFCFQRHIAHIKPKHDLVDVTFLFEQLRSEFVRRQVERKVVGVAQKTLNLKALKSIEILLPDREKQLEFSNVSKAIALRKEKTLRAKDLIEDLYNAILQRAFSGQLDLQIAVELDALLEEIDLQKSENDLFSIITNEEYLLSLVNRLNNQEFENQDLYDKAKHVAFQLLKEEERLAQEYDEEIKSLKLLVK
jgi:type I restriction enzyme S subunit